MYRFVDEYRRDFRTPVPFVAWVVLSVVVSLAGPFGTYEALDLPSRALFWSLTIACGIVVGAAIRAYVHGVLGYRDFLRGSSLIAAILTALFTPVLHLIVVNFFAYRVGHLPGPIEIAIFIYLVSFGVGAFRHALWSANMNFLPDTPASEPALPRLFDRIDPALRGKLLLISVRNHYVDIDTDLGRASVLMRFSDAINEVNPIDGAQVHRSYWVAWDAVEALEREGAKYCLRLVNGMRVPVSRNHLAKLESRGLL